MGSRNGSAGNKVGPATYSLHSNNKKRIRGSISYRRYSNIPTGEDPSHYSYFGNHLVKTMISDSKMRKT